MNNEGLLINISEELNRAGRKILLAQAKLDLLLMTGKNSRDDDVKYWTAENKTWTGYANQLNELSHHYKTIALGRTVMTQGDFHVEISAGGNHIKFFKKDNIPDEVMELIPATKNYLGNNPTCAVCGEEGTELHHWAPKELFPDEFEQWPTDYLCKKHHNEWHKKITIPYRVLRRTNEQ